MIIQCDHCSARFRMDDSKLANGPVKVRCAKCKEVFVVQPEAAAEPSPPQSPPQPAPSALGAETADDFSFDAPSSPVAAPSQSAEEFSFDAETPVIKSDTASTEPDSTNEFDWQAGTSSSFEEPQSSSDFDLSSFNSSIEVSSSPGSFSESSDFDFGDVDLTAKADSHGTDAAKTDHDEFSMDFGEVSFSESTTYSESAGRLSADVSAPAPASAPLADNSSESEKDGDFLLSFSSDTAQQVSPPPAVKEEREEVNFGEFSFGEMTETTAAASGLSAKVSQGKSADFEFIPAPGFPEYQDDEIPPSSLTTRKRGGSLFPVFVIAGAIVLVIALAGSGVYFFGGPKAFSKVGLGFLVEWYGDKAGEDGNITLKGVTASYTMNSTAGELFVVRGEAVNNFKKPRASIQIKASLVGPGGSILATKSAFCGNSLSNEQLATLPLAKIEEILGNQFGDSLANLGLKPGATIPFVVVVSPVPKEATDYTVVVGGSTVAAP